MGCEQTSSTKDHKTLNFITSDTNIISKELITNINQFCTLIPTPSINPPKISSIEKELLTMSLLYEINEVRTNPKLYIKKVKKYIDYIKPAVDQYTMPYIKVSAYSAIVLRKGIEAFENCITYLENKNPIKPLVMDSDLIVSFPNNIKECSKINYISDVIKEKCNELNCKFGDKIKIKKFHFDINAPSAEASCILQIVDDTASSLIRRNNIFNEEVNIIGINCEIVSKGIICYYLAFGEKN